MSEEYQEFFCPKCFKLGKIKQDPGYKGFYFVVNQIAEEHLRISPKCDNSIYNIMIKN